MTQRFVKLADYAKDRREALGLSQKEVAERANISINSYRAIEKGEGVRLTTVDAIDKALGWTNGSARAALEGEVPSPEPDFTLPEKIMEAIGRGDIIDSYVREFGHDGLQAVVIAVVPKGKSIPQIAKLIQEWTLIKAKSWSATQEHEPRDSDGSLDMPELPQQRQNGDFVQTGDGASTSENALAINYLAQLLDVHRALDN